MPDLPTSATTHPTGVTNDASSSPVQSRSVSGKDSLTLTAIVPAYNEEATVATLLKRLAAQPCVSAIIVVNDGSTDGTHDAIEAFLCENEVLTTGQWSELSSGQVFRIVQHERNYGKGRAIRTALDFIQTSHVIIQDADLEYDPADIVLLWECANRESVDVVYGSRYLTSSKLQKGRWLLQGGVRVLNWLVRVLYGICTTDEATCYKLFRTDDLKRMELQCERFEFCPEVSAKIAKQNLVMKEVPISYTPRKPAEGKKLGWRDGLVAIRELVLLKLVNVRLKVLAFSPLAIWVVLWVSLVLAIASCGSSDNHVGFRDSEVDLGTSSVLSIPFVNTSGNTVQILAVTPSCSCLHLEPTPRQIKSGASCQITGTISGSGETAVTIFVTWAVDSKSAASTCLIRTNLTFTDLSPPTPTPDPLFVKLNE